MWIWKWTQPPSQAARQWLPLDGLSRMKEWSLCHHLWVGAARTMAYIPTDKPSLIILNGQSAPGHNCIYLNRTDAVRRGYVLWTNIKPRRSKWMLLKYETPQNMQGLHLPLYRPVITHVQFCTMIQISKAQSWKQHCFAFWSSKHFKTAYAFLLTTLNKCHTWAMNWKIVVVSRDKIET